MSITSLFRKNSTGAARTQARNTRTAGFRPRLTVLEDRSVPSFGWAAAVGGSPQLGNDVASDAAGNVYMTGAFTSSFTPAGSNVTLTPAGGMDLFVAKYTRSGAFAWATSLGVAQTPTFGGGKAGSGIAVDAAGTSVYVAGENAAYVAQLNAGTGAMNWSRTLPGGGANSVAVDGSDAAYVISHLHGGDGTFHGNVTYVTKFDASGSQNWQDTISADWGLGNDATVAVSGNSVYVGGCYTNQVKPATFAIGSTTFTLAGSGSYVLKLTSDNAYGWVQTFQGFNGKGLVLNNTIAADSAGNVYAFGNFIGKVNFAASTTTAKGAWVLDAASPNGADFVTKLSPTGSFVWAKQFGPMPGGVDGVASAIAVDGAGSVYLAGNFTGTVSFNPAGGGMLTAPGSLPSAGIATFVSKLNTNGTFQWAIQGPSGGIISYPGIAVDPFGDIYVTGYIGAGTYDFDLTHTYGDNRDLVTTATGGGFLWQIRQP